MSGPRGRPGPGKNRLFGILPPSSRDRLWAAGRVESLALGQTLMNEGNRIEHVYFPLTGVISVLVVMRDGRSVDAATIGFEGMVGAPLVLGDEHSPYQVTVLVPGEALQIPAGDFRLAQNEDQALRDLLLRYVEVLLIQAIRSSACNRLHDVEERLARWLLLTHDLVWENTFHLTQDFLAAMLGVRRASVTIAAGAMQRAGLISYRRGDIVILDRQGLEDMACEDYFAIRDAFERLLALPPEAT